MKTQSGKTFIWVKEGKGGHYVNIANQTEGPVALGPFKTWVQAKVYANILRRAR